jgi:hypothetical protein
MRRIVPSASHLRDAAHRGAISLRWRLNVKKKTKEKIQKNKKRLSDRQMAIETLCLAIVRLMKDDEAVYIEEGYKDDFLYKID